MWMRSSLANLLRESDSLRALDRQQGEQAGAVGEGLPCHLRSTAARDISATRTQASISNVIIPVRVGSEATTFTIKAESDHGETNSIECG